MFNNSSNPWMLTEETSAPEFANLVSCYKFHLRNNTASIAQANEACSMQEDLVRLGTGTDVVFWLMGLLIIISNAVVLLGIIGTRELHRPIYFFLANLAITDVFAGIGLLYRTVGHVGHSAMYDFLMTYINSIIFAQMTSASALSLLSLSSYVAVKHPIYFHVYADNAKLLTVVAMFVSWIVFSLLAFSPSMGWNCLHMQTLTTGICISYYPLAFVITCASILFLLCIVMMFTNISILLAIREREHRRLEQAIASAHQASGENSSGQNNAAQEEANRKFEERVYKARTVMIHVVVSFLFWLLPLLLVAVCRFSPDICPRRNGMFAGFSLNSFINPLATLIRTADIRNAIWQRLTGVRQTLVTVIRGNRVNPQEDQAGTGDAPNLQEGPAHGEGQNTLSLRAPNEQPAVGNRVNPQEDQAGTGDAPNLQEGPAHGEGQHTPSLRAPDEQPAVGNRHYIIHDAHGMAEPERSRRGRQTEDLGIVEVG
ncbi:sphingosine 1-phosphate receptor 1-like [Branchiostoma lanceolatum]|uniref:sphingosine 1-phosphate receptor 1-like n=1 Tax=Branchiostoma lanceolatum TaxID=7740 RepID=UPI0034556331